MQMIKSLIRPVVGLGALIVVWGCGGEQVSPATVAEPDGLQASVAAMQTRADSAAVLRSAARMLALALGSGNLRGELKAALGRSSVREGKLHLQRFLRNRGTSFAQEVGLANRLSERGWSDAVERLPDLEMYLPIPAHRRSWAGTDDLMVTGFLETDDEIRARGGYTAYTTRGEELLIPYGEVPTRPVVVIYPVETQFGPTGEEPPVRISASLAVTDGGSSNIIVPPPGPGPNYCAGLNTSDTNVWICKIYIANIGQYEEALRGSPELAILTRTVVVNSNGFPITWGDLGCNNEDLTDASRLDMDGDTWGGRTQVVQRAILQSEQAMGRRIFILLWEDDNGSKCDFQPEGTTSPRNVSWQTMMRVADIFTIAGIGSGIDGNTSGWIVALASAVLSGVFGMFGNSGDDLIGSVTLPADSDPGKTLKDIRINQSTVVGNITFLLD